MKIVACCYLVSPSINSNDIRHINSLHLSQSFQLSFYVHSTSCMRSTGQKSDPLFSQAVFIISSFVINTRDSTSYQNGVSEKYFFYIFHTSPESFTYYLRNPSHQGAYKYGLEFRIVTRTSGYLSEMHAVCTILFLKSS